MRTSLMMASVLLSCGLATADEGSDKPQARLDELLRILPESQPWDEWISRTGERPPDFDALPSRALLPDPLVRYDGSAATRIGTPADWETRRGELKELFHRWVLGTVPPRPDSLEAVVQGETQAPGARVRAVELRFGPDHKARMRLELFIPDGPGPFPVFMTQHNHRQWALIALRRGYLACVYSGADSQDDTDSFVEPYKEYDWSRLTRRAWAASRCVDYLETVPEARRDQIALTGHSRNGKLSLIASALDERFAAVISSSSGAGGSMPARYLGEHHFGEGVENLTRQFPDWFHPRLRFFSGREHKLPVDLHELVALSAPRPCLLSIALNDGVESAWAMEQTYLSVKPVYALYGAEDRFRILWRPGGHETWPTVIERFMDWIDGQFGRGGVNPAERFIFPHSWDAWRAGDPAPLDPGAFPERPFDREVTAGTAAAERATLAERVRILLGTPPPTAPSPLNTYGEEPDHIEKLLNRADAGTRLEKHDVVFGDYLNGDVFMPAGTRESGTKVAAVLWLHPWSCPMGYGAAYRRGEQAFRTFARAGYAVFAYDQIGFGRRVEEIEGFYERYPGWSLMGQMVRDAQSALDAVAQLPYVDPARVYVVGYGTGAFVGLHLAAVDDRPAGFAFVCPPPPFRLDTDKDATGGIERWSRLYMLLPRLGYFAEQEDRVPYDVDELLAAAAPRPVVVVTPRLDREAPIALATQGVESARRLASRPERWKTLRQETPEAYNHFDERMQSLVVDWLHHVSPTGGQGVK